MWNKADGTLYNSGVESVGLADLGQHIFPLLHILMRPGSLMNFKEEELN